MSPSRNKLLWLSWVGVHPSEQCITSVHILVFKGTIIAIENKLDFEVCSWDAVESVYLLVTALFI